MEKKLDDAQKYNNHVISEVEKGIDPDSFFDWYMDTYHGHLIEAQDILLLIGGFLKKNEKTF